MIQIDDMAAFVAVVEAGSLTAAAARLGTTKSVVSRRLSDLEMELNTTLLERSVRGVRLTEVGAVYYAKSVRILEAVHSASEFVSGFNDIVAGPLKVVVFRSFHDALIMPVLNRFAAKYPDVVLQVETSGSGGLNDAEFDIALQSGEPGNSTDLVARALFEFGNVLCASPEYLQCRGIPQTPDEMVDHEGLLDRDSRTTGWIYRERGHWMQLRIRERLSSSDRQQLISAARDGLGIVLVPESMATADLESGRLCRILQDVEIPPGRISMLYPRSRRNSRKVQLLLAFLQEAFASQGMVVTSD